MAEFDRDYFVGAFRRMAEAAEVNRDEWTKLDGDIGDGDHGINMSIGFREVSKQLDALPDATDVGGLFKLVGMTLLRKVGGASGPLYGSFFMKAGAEVADQSEVSLDDLRRMLRAGVASPSGGRPQRRDREPLPTSPPRTQPSWHPAVDTRACPVGSCSSAATALRTLPGGRRPAPADGRARASAARDANGRIADRRPRSR